MVELGPSATIERVASGNSRPKTVRACALLNPDVRYYQLRHTMAPHRSMVGLLFNSPGDIQDSPFLTATAKFQLAPE
jgi:hypothetical protein